jgi:hypothetical protein
MEADDPVSRAASFDVTGSRPIVLPFEERLMVAKNEKDDEKYLLFHGKPGIIPAVQRRFRFSFFTETSEKCMFRKGGCAYVQMGI